MHYSRYSHIVGETEAQKGPVRRNTLGRVFIPGNGECNGLVRRSCNSPSNSQKEKTRVRELALRWERTGSEAFLLGQVQPFPPHLHLAP